MLQYFSPQAQIIFAELSKTTNFTVHSSEYLQQQEIVSKRNTQQNVKQTAQKLAYCILSFYFCINSANKQSNNKFNLQATTTQTTTNCHNHHETVPTNKGIQATAGSETDIACHKTDKRGIPAQPLIDTTPETSDRSLVRASGHRTQRRSQRL